MVIGVMSISTTHKEMFQENQIGYMVTPLIHPKPINKEI
jgi:hypothetical protein